MSSASRNSYLHRRLDSNRSSTNPRASTRLLPNRIEVGPDDAYTFALRIAYLNHLLQPKARKKQWVAALKPVSKPAHRSATSVGELVSQFGSSSSHTVKLPHGFRSSIEKRVQQVIQGTCSLPGFNDAAVRRSFASAYPSFTAAGFQKEADSNRKIEPYILLLYSNATRVAQSLAQPGDDSWKMIPDRHVALFVRLVLQVLRDQGHDRERPELITRLTSLESKLLTNDQNLAAASSQDGKMVEYQVPLSYDVKDMPMVLAVARTFGRSNSEVQADIDGHRNIWTEEAALRDMKTYQHRLSADAGGSLRKHDFDLDEAFEEWKKSEGPHLSSIIQKILQIKPELAKSSTTSSLATGEKPLPGRPQSFFGDDEAYSDLSRALSNPDSSSYPLDHSHAFSSLSLDDASGGRQLEDATYTFIPPSPRPFYKAILECCMNYDHLHSDPSQPYTAISKQRADLLVELSVWWRVPQFSRLIAFIEVAAKKFLDQELSVDQLDACWNYANNPPEDHKKTAHPPPLHYHAMGLSEIDRSAWTIHDFAIFRRTLQDLHEALLRDLYNQLQGCYGDRPPNIGALMTVLEGYIEADPAFSPRSQQDDDFARQVGEALKQQAREMYRQIVERRLPDDAEAWEFSHVVQMGKEVVAKITKMQKRYKKSDIRGVRPVPILIETMLPTFEQDAEHIIRKAIETSQATDNEIEFQEGFDLYTELVKLRETHEFYLSNQPFGFDIEELLVGFVWQWIHLTETRMTEMVENAIKQDKFEMMNPDPQAPDNERLSVSVTDMFRIMKTAVDEIKSLGWAKAIHVARFMTALGHFFASNIEKYCEEVSKIFAADLDRLSAQEIAAASRSAQEKFLHFAKDAWSNKEQPEPFQFSPKSFVILNNIEYAKQELDKLQAEAEIEACAEIIRQEEGPKPPTRKPNKYNFTVKIVEAEDLKACDPNGFSDPYVVLVDERQKRLHKTRVVRKSLNPRWDESRDITVTAPITIIATVWDDDMFGDHDFVGRTSFKLDPIHFSDYIPREIWLDLDTQGRLLVKISMEGERDDIEFQFGKAFRDLKRTEQTMVRKITDKLRDQINIAISHDTLRSLVRGGGIGASVTNLWKRASTVQHALTRDEIVKALQVLFDYFDENFGIMKQTLTTDTMRAVMLRLWKEVLMACENLLVPPLSDKPSDQRQLTQKELDIVYIWLEALFAFFNHKDENGDELGIAQNDLRSLKWHELAALNFFYFEQTNNLIRESERMAASNADRAKQALMSSSGSNRQSAPAAFNAAALSAFGSMGTIRRGKSIMMSRNLGTMRRAKEEKRKEAQADPSDDMILRILRMRPEAANYLKERSRQKERQSARVAAALIVSNSKSQGWNTGGGGGGGAYGRNSLPRR
ncbi:C2 domain-containing protein [Plectosphaerella plurivora]|uniref:C2 domain-containing protein n=1 Tax=Plectosphaerella plurivora TaxID=936078 RepID=A0A9P9AAL9_9PEZI|nr:C2 domain-containing protein [Plectosphaerella plurivora]